jgi:hypothetical protein
MIAPDKSCPLAAALIAMLPGSTLLSHQQQDWHSGGLSGVTLVSRLRVGGADCVAQARLFADALPEAQFDIGDQMFVADIKGQLLEVADGAATLEIEALLLAQ